MEKRNFTLIELLVVITIIAILSSMLFPSFGKMQRKALRNNSMALAKEYNGELLMWFSDVRHTEMPELTDVYGFGAYTMNGQEARWQEPAGGIRYGYPKAFFPEQSITATSNKYNVFDTETMTYNRSATGNSRCGTISQDSNGWRPLAGSVWRDCNNEQSATLTCMYRWTLTNCSKPVAFGDGHVISTGNGEF